MKKILNNRVSRLLCVVCCAAAGTAMALLIAMLLIVFYGRFHGLSRTEMEQLVMERISGVELCDMVEEMAFGYRDLPGVLPLTDPGAEAEDGAAVLPTEADQNKMLEELRRRIRQTAEKYADKVSAEYAVILSKESYPGQIELTDDDVYLYRTPGYDAYTNYMELVPFASSYYRRDNFLDIVTEGPRKVWYHSDGLTLNGMECHILVLYKTSAQALQAGQGSGEDLHNNGEIRAFLSDIYRADRMGIPGVVILFLVALAFLILYCIGAGRTNGGEEVKTSFLDRTPLEILGVGVILAELALAATLYMLLKLTAYDWGSNAYGLSYAELVWMGVGVFFVMMILAVATLGSIVVRIKTRTFLKSSLCFRLSVLFGKAVKKAAVWAAEHFPLFARAAVILPVFGIASIVEAAYLEDHTRKGAVLFVLLRAGVIALIIFLLIGYSKLRDGAMRIAAGKLDVPVDEKYLLPDYRMFAHNLNSVGESIQIAVEERMKSEHLKTQLITNVSHDIKTPLTSIINYVDLLQKEDVSEEEKKEYLAILARQSDRLKKLIQDLIDASKASSGAVEVKLSEADLCTMAKQVLGEYQDKFEEAHLTTVCKNMDSELKVSADYNLLWRVMDNLFGNVLKYAMPGTRVYAEVRELDGTASFSISNISKDELGISGDELMERFVRGDRSRNTEGSGLGLSIAKSLMELMGGTLEINVDGDMFKAVIKIKAQS
ncbi:MAG: HAMP domain-containing histidine kinase [Lachnospiraceae bacterium]|nr:HAMP domain-containing histidine kinase [Lachnospiraceae bacterium]